MEPEKPGDYPPPYSPAQSQYPPPAGGYPPPQPQPYPTGAQYPQYPTAPTVATQPVPGQFPPPAAAATSTTVVVAPTPVVVGAMQYGYHPVHTTCPYCHAGIVTAVDHEVGTLAWIICGSIVLVGLFILPCALLGCCFIPFCINDCKDAVHICPSCKQTLGRVPRLK